MPIQAWEEGSTAAVMSAGVSFKGKRDVEGGWGAEGRQLGLIDVVNMIFLEK